MILPIITASKITHTHIFKNKFLPTYEISEVIVNIEADSSILKCCCTSAFV